MNSLLLLTYLTARVDANTSLAHMYGYEILLGFATGTHVQMGVSIIQAVVDKSQRAYAVSFIMLGQPPFLSPE